MQVPLHLRVLASLRGVGFDGAPLAACKVLEAARGVEPDGALEDLGLEPRRVCQVMECDLGSRHVDLRDVQVHLTRQGCKRRQTGDGFALETRIPPRER